MSNLFPWNTGSFRKNGKSKTVFMGTKFHEKLIFSAFFSRELATNLRSWATRSVTITLWHPENVAPPVWFQALVGCLKPTTDPETLSKDHKGVFWSVRGTMALLKNMNVFIQLICSIQVKIQWGACALRSWGSGQSQSPYQGLKPHWRRHILRMPQGNCDRPGSSRA